MAKMKASGLTGEDVAMLARKAGGWEHAVKSSDVCSWRCGHVMAILPPESG
jgi:hypothetical protein